jgi:hypothetical protein
MQKITYSLFILLILSCQNLFAQASCSIDQVTALGQCVGSAINLEVKISGTLVNLPNAIQWSQVSGIAMTIKDANNAKALIAPAISDGSFSFKITAQCEQGGSVEKIITHTVFPKPNAGSDATSCEKSIDLQRVAPIGAKWSVVSGNPANATINAYNTVIGNLDVEGDFFLP